MGVEVLSNGKYPPGTQQNLLCYSIRLQPTCNLILQTSEGCDILRTFGRVFIRVEVSS